MSDIYTLCVRTNYSSAFTLELADADRLGRLFDGTEVVTAYVSGMGSLHLKL